jgi:LAO/AO transport system kinase
VPVLKVTAATGEGIAALAAAIEDAARRDTADPLLRRRRRARYLIARAAADLVAGRVRQATGATIDALADEVLCGALLPAEAARRLVDGQV